MNFPACDDCSQHLDDDNTAPSCPQHDLCQDCAAYWTCGGCRQALAEVNEDHQAEADFDHTRGN